MARSSGPADRLKLGQPVRVGELARLTGWGVRTIQMLVREGGIKSVQLAPGGERRVPASEAQRIVREAGVRIPE